MSPTASERDEVALSDLFEARLRQLDIELRALAKLVDERDRLYKERSEAAKEAVNAALTAQKEMTANAFKASEKAIEKAEVAQTAYNQRSNEFRAALDDTQQKLMSRIEAGAKFENIDNRLELNRSEIAEIRETLSASRGGKDKSVEHATDTKWIVATVLFGALSLLSLLVSAVNLVMKFNQ